MAAIDQDVELTTMAIRERLMEYFKGTCIEAFVRQTNVGLVSASVSSRMDFTYLRREHENQRPMILMIGQLPIMTLQKNPERVVLHTRLLTRSPELRAINKSIRQFMEKYLSGVEVKKSRKGVVYANN